MIHFIGAIFVSCGCSYFGFLKAQELKRNVFLTEKFIIALSHMKREITQHQRFLPDIIETLSTHDTSMVGKYFHHLKEQLEEPDSFRIKWTNSMIAEPFLPEKLIDILEPLGSILGQYDSQRQGEALSQILEQLASYKEFATEESHRLGKVYGTIGITFGLFIVILLL